MTTQVTSPPRPMTHPATLGTSLRIAVTCSPRALFNGGAKHEVVLNSDWSIDTPHDLKAERTATAFGGYCDCLTLLDIGILAAGEWLELHLRERTPEVCLSSVHGWQVTPVSGCDCHSDTTHDRSGSRTVDADLRFQWIDQAVRHATSVRHIAAKHGAQIRHVGPVSEALARHWLPEVRKAQFEPELAARVRDPSAPRAVWLAGIHPRVAMESAARVPNRTPISLSYLIGMTYATAYAGRDEELVGQLDGVMAAWLVWSRDCSEPRRPLAYAGWLGLPSMDPERARMLLDMGYDSGAADELGTVLGFTPDEAASLLFEWVRLGCDPTVDDLMDLGASFLPPTAELVQATLGSPRIADVDITRTQVALLLARVGRVEPVLDAIDDGIRTTREFRRWIGSRRDH